RHTRFSRDWSSDVCSSDLAGYWTIGLLIGGLSIPAFARLARAATISVREHDYVQAARNMGAGPLRIMRTEIIPNVLPAIGAYSRSEERRVGKEGAYRR